MTESRDDDAVVLIPLCRNCVRDVPVAGTDLCNFCRVIGEGERG